MRNILIVIALAIVIACGIAWQLDMFKTPMPSVTDTPVDSREQTTPESQLGGFLFPGEFPKIALPKLRGTRDPIVAIGVMNPFEVEEVPCRVQNGTVLFVGEQVDDAAVMVAGSAAFITEPYYPSQEIDLGDQKIVKFYRRLYEGQPVRQNQMLALINPQKALGAVLEKEAKVKAAEAEHIASIAGKKEGRTRYDRADDLYKKGAGSKEDRDGAYLTWKKLEAEEVTNREKVNLAIIDKNVATAELSMHELRATLQYKTCTIKTIHRPAGTYLKQLDPVVITVQSLERLLAEASIEEQYYSRIKDKSRVVATIEPTVLEAPTREWHGHDADVTCVAVAKDLMIVSGSEDRTVCVWNPHEAHVHRRFEHDDAVKAIACTPVKAKRNLCVVGCADGNLWLWDLDADATTPLAKLDKPHGYDVTITAVAFSPNGDFFATGGSDGSIRLWVTEADGKYAEEKYPFTPKYGVAQAHEEGISSLHFTPQSRLVSAARDKTLRVWKLYEKGACADGHALRNRDGNVRNLGVSEDGSYMLFDQGRTLKFLSVENRTMVHSINLPPNSVPFDTLAILSPDGSLMLTAGAPEGRLQLWRTPTADDRGFEVRTFAPRERDRTVACAAFSPSVASADMHPFAVSGSGQKIFLWSLPTPEEVRDHRIIDVPLTIKTQVLDLVSRTARIGFEVANPPSERYPNGRFEAGRPVTIVIP
ncbi:MAG TPA: hypothetical protein VFE62_03300 [Gemmataceae bacterium]|nr:hypothetical protein [Gemmataceae bacterium]